MDKPSEPKVNCMDNAIESSANTDEWYEWVDKSLSESVITYKGFDKSFACRSHQYEIGKTYTHPKHVAVCQSGFHACEYPLDVFNYYSPSNSRFAIVKQSGIMQRHSDDSKIASSVLTVRQEVSIPEFVKLTLEYIHTQCTASKPVYNIINTTYIRGVASNLNTYGVVNNSGRHGAAISTNRYGAAFSSTDRFGVACNTGDHGIASNISDYGIAGNIGVRGAANSDGYMSIACSTRESSVAVSNGFQCAAANVGFRGVAFSTGIQSAAVCTSRHAVVTSNGICSAAVCTGEYGSANSIGNCTVASNTGYRGAASVNGKSSIALAAGDIGKAKATLGSAIVLVKRDTLGTISHIRCGIAGQDIEPDTWYTLDSDGEFVIAPEY